MTARRFAPVALLLALGAFACSPDPSADLRQAVTADLTSFAEVAAWRQLDRGLWQADDARPSLAVNGELCHSLEDRLQDLCKERGCVADVAHVVIDHDGAPSGNGLVSLAAFPRCVAELRMETGRLDTLLRFDLDGDPADLPRCGDGVLDSGEECDDADLDAGDGCGPGCLTEVCGNGRLDTGEGCDDGNLEDGDGCTALCAIEACGNGVIDPGEQCDDGNELAGDGCSAACALESCGNGVVEAGEECDDGNAEVGDGCSDSCAWEYCGNGVVDPFEECDGGEDCNWNCGDGVCSTPDMIPGLDCAVWAGDPGTACDPDCIDEGFWGMCESIVENRFAEAQLADIDQWAWSREGTHLMVHRSAARLDQRAGCAGVEEVARGACDDLVRWMGPARACSPSWERTEDNGCAVRLEIDFWRTDPALGVWSTELPGVLSFQL